MHSAKQVRLITLILGIIAGYCDTVTFTSANGLLSAHITGNLILFAGRLIRTSDLISWVRLLAFPVFVLSVIIGGWIARRPQPRRLLLLIEGLILCLAGAVAFLLKLGDPSYYNVYIYPIALTVVFAMGLQNAYGKLFTADIYGPTTAMTGNVTQWAIDLGKLIRGTKDPLTLDSFKKAIPADPGLFLRLSIRRCRQPVHRSGCDPSGRDDTSSYKKISPHGNGGPCNY